LANQKVRGPGGILRPRASHGYPRRDEGAKAQQSCVTLFLQVCQGAECGHDHSAELRAFFGAHAHLMRLMLCRHCTSQAGPCSRWRRLRWLHHHFSAGLPNWTVDNTSDQAMRDGRKMLDQVAPSGAVGFDHFCKDWSKANRRKYPNGCWLYHPVNVPPMSTHQSVHTGRRSTGTKRESLEQSSAGAAA
jgi:hypothetical protein